MAKISPEDEWDVPDTSSNRKAHWFFYILLVIFMLAGGAGAALTVFYVFVPNVLPLLSGNPWTAWVSYVRLGGTGLALLGGIFAFIIALMKNSGFGVTFTASIFIILAGAASAVSTVFDALLYIPAVIANCANSVFNCTDFYPYILLGCEAAVAIIGLVSGIWLTVIANRRKSQVELGWDPEN